MKNDYVAECNFNFADEVMKKSFKKIKTSFKNNKKNLNSSRR